MSVYIFRNGLKAIKLKSFETKCWKFIHGEVDDDGADDLPLSQRSDMCISII